VIVVRDISLSTHLHLSGYVGLITEWFKLESLISAGYVMM